MPKTETNKKKRSLIKELDKIIITGARENNLKNIDIEIPKKKLVVITGVSGSGKSSLAFNTIYAEGQRRYVESLSSYARQFLGQMEKPKYETIRGLSPTIAIEQKSASKNPRSTVGTITEVYDYLRVMYARLGIQKCHFCGKKVGRGDAESMVQQILALPEGTKILLMAPIVENRKGEHRELLQELRSDGYARVRIDGVVGNISDVQTLAKHKKHKIDVVVDRLVVQKNKATEKRTTDSVETALKRGNGQIIVHVMDREDIKMSEMRTCCQFAFPELEPARFSFNAPSGMCETCNGIGTVLAMDEKKVVVDPTLSISKGAVENWCSFFEDGKLKKDSWGGAILGAMNKQWGVDLNKPWNKLPKAQRELMLRGVVRGKEGVGKTLNLRYKGHSYETQYDGLLNRLLRRYQKTTSDGQKVRYQKMLASAACKTCSGDRLRPEILAVTIQNKSIAELTRLNVEEALKFITSIKLTASQKIIADELIKEIRTRLEFLLNVGLGYLSLDRKGPTLSGGEAQRIRLASQICTELTGVLYILDEPSIGLHQRDNKKLIETLMHLRDIGNSLIVVEHDEETMMASDYVIDIGPGAGHLGGQVIAAGTPKQLIKDKKSTTGMYLSGRLKIEVPQRRRSSQTFIEIIGATENNLKNVNTKIPVGVFTCLTGVSGAGKSTLINQILYPALSNKLTSSDLKVGDHKSIKGIEHFDKVINIDQKAIGRTPRSNPATYTKLFDMIRDFFALLPESKMRGYAKGRFSFNVKGGRCEECQGDGFIKVEMHFLADVFVPCEKCHSRRFNKATLEVMYRGHNISDVLNLSVREACDLFGAHPRIKKILDTLMAVGLGYIKLGQPATTMSGGEAQRIKLSRELGKRDTGRTLYILDEPTTGLHFQDIKNLLGVLQSLVDSGNTVIVIEHNLDVIKTADWVIDVGPEGGHRGGQVIAEGTPEKISKSKKSHTGRCLQPLL